MGDASERKSQRPSHTAAMGSGTAPAESPRRRQAMTNAARPAPRAALSFVLPGACRSAPGSPWATSDLAG
jgi:hypothetical protein